MLAFIEKLGLPLLHQAGREIEGAKIGLDSQYQETVLERLLEPTLNYLARESPAAYRALQLAALCPPDNVPLPWPVVLLSVENPEWNTDRPGGTPAAQAVTLLKGLRILVPIRRQCAGLVAEAVHVGNLARLHRVYQNFIVRRMTDEDQEAINGLLRLMVMYRAEELWRTWGKPEVAWELWPLLDFAHRFSTEDSQETVRLLDHVAETVRNVGRMGDVERLTKRLVEIMQRLSASAPENADYARDLSVSYNKMGDLYRALGNGVEARAFYEKALEVRERLSASAPENADYARDLDVSHDMLFNFLLEEKQIEEAVPHLNRFLQVWLPLAERGALPDPNDQKYLMEQLELAKKLGLFNDQTDTCGES